MPACHVAALTYMYMSKVIARTPHLHLRLVRLRSQSHSDRVALYMPLRLSVNTSFSVFMSMPKTWTEAV